ncbi:two-component system sensor histidine kinase DesK [Saccharothrix tamanrassetensis]|uniref:Two-component system sensor histidine kinase DesK n=1 Tax=Saccharothrix tamanrassetensis TaxID=1051531 RepID=A0A841CIQ2_9PSEU|nr:histidine kinase [Saccharothrix tamanrassetensis]MBB5956007.1 two-component system sensor histidine kinase DesK [Saccharothrix tamanrassetensis]
MRRARLLTLVSVAVAWSTSLVGPGIGVLMESRSEWVVLGTVGVVLFAVAHAGVLYAAVSPVRRGPWIAAFAVASLLSVSLLVPVAPGHWETWAWVGASIVGTAPVLARRWWGIVVAVIAAAVVLADDPLRGLVIAGGVGIGLALVHVLPVWLWDLLVQAQEGRESRARLAVIEERLRFARDVHDLLGHRLTVIALKAELAERLAPVDGARAGAEAGEVRGLAASALADLREAVHGYRTVDLAEQAAAIEQVLTSSGVRCTVTIPPSLPTVARELSWALREAGTNVLRHSRARWCTIDVALEPDLVRLAVANDGASGGPGGGSGLDGLAERLAKAGGTLRTGEEGGVFTLVATVPT